MARLLGERLGWKVFDKDLLDRVAERFHEPRLMLDLVDETPSNWAFDVLGSWMDPEHRHAPAIPGARDGGHPLAGPQWRRDLRGPGKPVRLAAPPDAGRSGRGPGGLADRAGRETEGPQHRRCPAVHARDGRGAAEFVRRFFRRDIDNPTLYDLIVNVEHFGLAGAVELIVLALCRGWAVEEPEPGRLAKAR